MEKQRWDSPFCLKQTKYIKQLFLRSVNEGQWLSELYSIESVFRPQSREGLLRHSLKIIWDDGVESPGRPRWLKIEKQSTVQEGAAQRELHRFTEGPPQIFHSAPIILFLWRNYLRLGKETYKDIKSNIL